MRGTNENTNGMIRQYLPKGQGMKHLTQHDCNRIAAKCRCSCCGRDFPWHVLEGVYCVE